MSGSTGRGDEPIRITTVGPTRAEEIQGKQRRYLWSMLIRTVCFIGAVAADGWLRWALVVGAVFLPYIAVIFANAMPATRAEEHLPSARWGHELPPRPE